MKNPFAILDYVYIAKIILSGAIAVALSAYLKLTPANAMMMIFYAMLLVSTTFGETVSNVKNYVMWALLGAILGGFLVFVSSTHYFHISIWWTIVGLVIIGGFILPIHPAAKLSIITALFVLVNGNLTHQPIYQASLRIMYLGIAVVIAVPISLFLWPRKMIKVIQETSLSIKKIIYDKICEVFYQLDHDELNAHWQEDHSIRNMIALQRKLDDNMARFELAKLEGYKEQESLIYHHYRIERRMVHYTSALIRILPKMINNPIRKKLASDIKTLTDTLLNILNVWCYCSITDEGNIDLETFRQEFHRVEERISTINTYDEKFSIDTISEFYNFFYTLRLINQALLYFEKA